MEFINQNVIGVVNEKKGVFANFDEICEDLPIFKLTTRQNCRAGKALF